ncbi:MAG: ATPase domain-containing protein [Zestosphaera sp.]
MCGEVPVVSSKGGGYVWGVESLDDILGGVVSSGALVLVAGYPGSGKTLLAATVCHANAVRGFPCLYVSFQETKEVFFRHMKDFNMDFSDLESRDLFMYYRIPVIVDPSLVNTIVNELSKHSSKYRVIVIDSFTPLERVIEKEAEARALLQNFFYNLTKLERSLILVIAEVPLGRKALNLGDSEFIADVILLMRYKLDKGLMTRFMEVRKAREAPVSLGEIPFKIVDGVGIHAFLPPLLEELPPALERTYEYPCRIMNEILGPVKSGSSMLVVTPADARSTETYIPGLVTLSIALKHRLRTLIVSYVRTPYSLLNSILNYASKKSRETFEAVRELLDDLVRIEYVNPAAMSLEELYTYEIDLVRRYNPQILILNRVDIPTRIHGTKNPEKYFMYMWNELLWFRGQGVTTLRNSVYMSKDFFRRSASVSDLVVRLTRGKEGELKLYVWGEGKNPRVIELRLLSECFDEFLEGVSGGGANTSSNQTNI